MRGSWLTWGSVPLLTACVFWPSAKPIPFTPHPERVTDPMAVLREAAQPSCQQGVRVDLVGRKVRYTSTCATTWSGKPVAEDVDLDAIDSVRIVLGDWYQVKWVHGDEEQDLPHSASSEGEAILIADALLALRDRR